MTDREQIREQMKKDNVEFILAQFVDIHGSAKVKMVPASCLDDMIDVGAGFAGAAVDLEFAFVVSRPAPPTIWLTTRLPGGAPKPEPAASGSA